MSGLLRGLGCPLMQNSLQTIPPSIQALSSVARGGAGGGSSSPIGLWSMQNRTFLVLLRPIFCEKLKIAPPPHRKTAPLQRLNFRFWPKNQFQFRRRPFFLFFLETTWFWAEKTFEFWISAEKSVSISAKTFFFFFLRPPGFGRKKPSNFREISSEFSDKPCETDSRTMKIQVKVVCTFLTLWK